jgi:uncharacterized damage-inducible protein DinB
MTQEEEKATVDHILTLLTTACDGPLWHGPALRQILAGMTQEEAAARPLPERHGIAEIVLHLTAWMEEVGARLGGRPRQQPDRGDWPSAEGRAWRDVEAAFDRAYEDLLTTMRELPPGRLEARIGEGDGDISMATMLYGVAQHCVYHSGQIALLRRAPRPAV